MTEIEKKDIEELKKLLSTDSLYIDFSQYSKITAFTNESINPFFNRIPSGNSAYCVLASGDQIFDLILRGYYKFDTFDINRFVEYYVYGLKMTAIKRLEYNDFFKLFGCYNDESFDLFKYLIQFMPVKYRNFWLTYHDLVDGQKDNGTILTSNFIGGNKSGSIADRTKYLNNESYYNLLKNLLSGCTFNHQVGDIMHDINIDKSYDLIYLSNILDYYGYERYQFVKKLYINNLNDEGSIAYCGTKESVKIYPLLKLKELKYNFNFYDWDYYTINKTSLSKIRSRRNSK